MSTVILTVQTLHERGHRTVAIRFPSYHNLEGEYFGIKVTSTDFAGKLSREVQPVRTEMFVEPWNPQHVRVVAPLLPIPLIEEIRSRTRDEESFEVEVDAHVFGLFVEDMRQMMSI
jgi:hypothetical protein